jgi:hypothetical protein
MTVVAPDELECSAIRRRHHQRFRFGPAERQIENGLVPAPLRKSLIANALQSSLFFSFRVHVAHATGKRCFVAFQNVPEKLDFVISNTLVSRIPYTKLSRDFVPIVATRGPHNRAEPRAQVDAAR